MEAVMIRMLRAVERAYARPPLSWLVDGTVWAGEKATAPLRVMLRPVFRRHAIRKAAQLDLLAAGCTARGWHAEAVNLAELSARWSGIANDLGEPR